MHVSDSFINKAKRLGKLPIISYFFKSSGLDAYRILFACCFTAFSLYQFFRYSEYFTLKQAINIYLLCLIANWLWKLAAIILLGALLILPIEIRSRKPPAEWTIVKGFHLVRESHHWRWLGIYLACIWLYVGFWMVALSHQNIPMWRQLDKVKVGDDIMAVDQRLGHHLYEASWTDHRLPDRAVPLSSAFTGTVSYKIEKGGEAWDYINITCVKGKVTERHPFEDD